MNKKVSIIMGVYNSEETIHDSIQSILKQTYQNWELIICDDASSDNTGEIIAQYEKKYPNKIIVLRNDVNSKLSYSLNKCLKHATGEYIARMDADDISASDRLEKQVRYLLANENIDLVGTSMQRFTDKKLNDVVYSIDKPNYFTLKNRIPFYHATILTYKYVYDTLGGYTVSKLTERSQDVELWFRFFKEGFQGENIIEPLYYVREDKNAIKRRTNKVRLNALKIQLNGYKLLNYPKKWYIPPIGKTILKMLTPQVIQIVYRKYQGFNYSQKNG